MRKLKLCLNLRDLYNGDDVLRADLCPNLNNNHRLRILSKPTLLEHGHYLRLYIFPMDSNSQVEEEEDIVEDFLYAGTCILSTKSKT